ncbi:MAG: hypothetical protein M1837_006296 [Sclerophora amabilis]|nr:MAG: hypothetical protein M1837_006296 [Sclerophora amabilis]
MALSIGEQLQSLERFEKEQLYTKLAEKDVEYPQIDHLMSQYRAACQHIIFQDFESASSKNVEGRLWDGHSKVNARFRKELSRFRGEDGAKKPVEKRKMSKHYLEFIKASQRFYRGYIKQLSLNFGGIPELERVAHRFERNQTRSDMVDDSKGLHLKGDSSGRKEHVSERMRKLILLSCHQTLVRLGDLSRYRETEIVTKNRNWGPAIGYYDLAGAIRPGSGASHNQLAVIALADGNHLRATYHLYRALAVKEPYPSAKNNLEIEFKKVLAAWDKGELITNGPSQDGNSSKALLAWFVRLHARCYKGEDFAEHDELENEVLSQLAVDLKERSLENTLHKFVLINISAEYFASVRLQLNPDSTANYQAYLYFLRLNVKTFFTLLQILLPELERLAVVDSDTQSTAGAGGGSEKVTAITRRILPALRQYSSWLLSNQAILLANVLDNALTVQVKELWKIYGNSLTLLAASYPATDLPTVEYLLEEDEDTLGFAPFKPENCGRRYFSDDTERPKWHDQGNERHHVDAEMLSRIRDFLTDGLELTIDESTPIVLVNGTTFTYEEEGLPSESLAMPEVQEPLVEVAAPNDRIRKSAPSDPQPILSSNSFRPAPVNPPIDGTTTHPKVDDSQSVGNSESTSLSMSSAMNHMVDDLVGEAPVANYTAPSPSFVREECSPHLNRGPLTARDTVNSLHPYSEHLLQNQSRQDFAPAFAPSPTAAQHTPRPSLPSIWNTPFAAQPHSPGSITSAHSRPSSSRRINADLTPSGCTNPNTPTQAAVSSMAPSRAYAAKAEHDITNRSFANKIPPTNYHNFIGSDIDDYGTGNGTGSDNETFDAVVGGSKRGVGVPVRSSMGKGRES